MATKVALNIFTKYLDEKSMNHPGEKNRLVEVLKMFYMEAELQKSHGYSGITREEGLQNGQSVRKVSCQHTT